MGRQLWYSNIAVLDLVTQANLQPSQTFKASTQAHAIVQDLYVFFKTASNIGRRGYLILDAPVGFDFTTKCEPDMSIVYNRNVTQEPRRNKCSCTVNYLPEDYYAYSGLLSDGFQQTRKIPGKQDLISC